MRSFAQCLPAFARLHAAEELMPHGLSGQTARRRKFSFQPYAEERSQRGSGTAPATSTGRTRRKDHHGGAVGHAALQVLHTLIFDFLNYRSGRLDPSYAAIARAANVCERTVANALKRLRELGILNWVRRCREEREEGRFVLKQETNAYAVLPPSQWRGYKEPPEPPPPAPGTWGDLPPLPPVLAQAVAEQQASGSLRTVIGILDSDPGDKLADALARLGRVMQGANPQ